MRAVFTCLLVLALCGRPASSQGFEFNDSHFHLTNYIQTGLTLPEFLRIMGDKTGRVALFGIPIQQKWDHFETGDRAPDYYLLSGLVERFSQGCARPGDLWLVHASLTGTSQLAQFLVAGVDQAAIRIIHGPFSELPPNINPQAPG